MVVWIKELLHCSALVFCSTTNMFCWTDFNAHTLAHIEWISRIATASNSIVYLAMLWYDRVLLLCSFPRDLYNALDVL